jgi:hypothetical protein
MDYSKARHQLLLHGPGTCDATGQPLILEDGFVASLRPYSGLHEKNFHLVMQALLVVGERIHREPQVDRELVKAVWSICETGRSWGLHPDGMLQRNKLITTADTKRLELWIDTIEGTVLHLLGGWSPHWAVTEYAEYVVAVGWWENIASFLPLLGHAVSDPDLPAGAIEVTVDALGKLGRLAASTLPELRAAELRSYTWYTPEERCTEDVRARIRAAILAIEGVQEAGPGSVLSGGDS